MGFTLQELAINTTNQDWNKTFYDRTLKENKDKPLFKKLSISGLAMYLHHESVVSKLGDSPIKQIGIEFTDNIKNDN